VEQTPELSPKKISPEGKSSLSKAALDTKKIGLRGIAAQDDSNPIIQERVNAFSEEYLKNGGDSTKAAMAVFNMDSKLSAAQVGSFYLKKAKVLNRIFLEEKGYPLGRLLEIAAEKAERSRMPDWFDRVMILGGWMEPGWATSTKTGTSVTNVNIIQSEKELFKKYTMQNADIVDEESESEENGKGGSSVR